MTSPPRVPKPRTASTAQRIAQGSLLLGGGLLVGIGVLIGSVITWRLRAPDPPLLEAADPPLRSQITEPNYDLLRPPVANEFRAITATAAIEARREQAMAEAQAVEAPAVATAPAKAAKVARGPRRPTQKDRVARKRNGAPETADASGAAGMKALPQPAVAEETAPVASAAPAAADPGTAVEITPEEREEAARILAASDAIKRAPDAELRAKVKALAETPVSAPRIIKVRDRCGAVYLSLLDGLARLDKVAEKMTAGGSDDAKVRQELEAADAAAEAAKRGVLACEAGLAKLRMEYGFR